MSEPLARITQRLRPLATIAGYILAIYGLLAVGFPPLRWLYSKLTFSDVAGIARPICELDPLPDTSYDDSGMRLAGVQLLTMKRLEGVKFEFRGLDGVIRWTIHSDGLSPLEQRRVLDQLPSGRVLTVVTATLPSLPDSTSTTLQALAFLGGADCRGRDWVTVTASNGKVYRSDPGFIPIWGIHFHPLEALGAAVVIGIVVYVIRRRRSTPRPS